MTLKEWCTELAGMIQQDPPQTDDPAELLEWFGNVPQEDIDGLTAVAESHASVAGFLELGQGLMAQVAVSGGR